MKFTFAPQAKPLLGYTIKRAIHRGGFGEVYYAITDAGKEVALKLLNQHTDVELRGVTQCLNLKHPNLVTIFDIKTDADDDNWIVMEYVSGDNLATVLGKNPKGLPLDKVTHWLEGITSGLSYLHDRGIVHRDLKPANIYSEGDIVKIGDVGLSKFITESRRNAQTQSVGTVYYMAPEVANGRYGREVDVYSLGVMLFELITGNVPFDGESAGEILMKHLSAKPDLSSLPENLRPVLARALTKDPQKRTPSASVLLKEFKQALAGESIALEIPAESFVGQPAPSKSQEQEEVVFLNGKSYSESQLTAIRQNKNRKKKSKCRKRGLHSKHKRVITQLHQQQTERPRTRRHPAVNWLIAVVVIFAVIAIAGGTGGGMTGEGSLLSVLGRQLFIAGILGTLVYVAARLTMSTTDSAVRLFTGNHQTTEDGSEISERNFNNGHSRGLRYEKLTHHTPRSISIRHRMTELTGSMTIAVLCTTLITAGLYFFDLLVTTPGEIAFFGGVTLLASWGVMASTKLIEGRELDNLSRRVMLLLVGAATGLGAFYLNGLFHASVGDVHHPAMFDSIGRLNLIESGAYPRQPTMAGYIVFFTALFAIRRWWVQADSFRKKRFRVMSVAFTALLAWGISLIWYFPANWAVTWGAAICSVVHLASIWVPRADRWKMVRHQDQQHNNSNFA